MKRILALFLISSAATAASIPLETFDQSKLETIVRRIPSALVKTEQLEGFVRKYYLYPSESQTLFTLNCHADYFGEATIPTYKVCSVNVPGEPATGDEFLITTTDTKIVGELFNAISFGTEVKKNYSNELIYGQAHDGSYKNLFRYSIVCKINSCQLTFSPKAANF